MSIPTQRTVTVEPREIPRHVDMAFLNAARLEAEKSKDPSTKTGCALVTGSPAMSAVASGHNRFPRDLSILDAYYTDRPKKYSRILHAEVVALMQTNKDLTGGTAYIWPFLCCDRCAAQLIERGISRVVTVKSPSDKDERWKANLEEALGFLWECGVEVTIYDEID